MDFIDRYFDRSVQYPKEILFDILPWGVYWMYISSTFLNGLINYIKPEKAYLLDRYTAWDERGAYRYIETQTVVTKETCTKQESLDAFYVRENLHTDLNMFGDDIMLLGSIEDVGYIMFWFDSDLSDCCIGRFKTDDSLEDVKRHFSEYVSLTDKNLKGYRGNKELCAKELPIDQIKTWISF